MARYGLNPASGTTYNAECDPTIYNSYATAAFRFGHSQVYNTVRMALVSGTLKATAGFPSTMFSADRFYKANGETVMRRVSYSSQSTSYDDSIVVTQFIICVYYVSTSNAGIAQCNAQVYMYMNE